jgi:hypothetical protein
MGCFRRYLGQFVLGGSAIFTNIAFASSLYALYTFFSKWFIGSMVHCHVVLVRLLCVRMYGCIYTIAHIWL